jgi:hypothetical protein
VEITKTVLPKPFNAFAVYAPTFPSKDAAFVLFKHNLAEQFQREKFSGME